MTENQADYRQIVKTTSIFGGVQVFQIITGIVRSKFIAVLLGPLGMGIAGLLNSTIELIAGMTNFGLSTSAVKDISAAHSSENSRKVATKIVILRRLVWITGLLGTATTALLSPWLSQLAFGNKDYTFAFIWISVTLLLNQISAGQGVLLRGMRHIRYLAQSGMIGSVIGLFTTIPFYYFYGIKGIVPAIVVTAVTTLLLTWYYANKLKVKPIYVSKAQTIAEGKEMMKMGFMISLSGLITLGASFIVRIYISKTGGIDQVGLYNAGFAIITTYVGLVFSAMATDYYPRLSVAANSNAESKKVINQQAEISLLVLSPVIMVFLVFINWVVIILYSTKFVPVSDMILYAALGMFFKAVSWSVAFIFLAKGASKLYFWSELITNIYLLALNLIGYKYYGLTGLGVSFIVAYILYAIQVYLIAKYKYEFSFKSGFYKIFGLQLLLAIGCTAVVKLFGNPYSYVIGSIFIVVSAYFAYKELDKRIDMKSMLLAIKSRF